MRKAPAAAAKPKPRARARGKAKPKPKPSPDSLLSGASSPSDASDGSPSPSPVALGRGLPSAAKPKPRARARAKPKPKPSPDSLLSGASSPSDASAGSPSPSPVVGVRRGFLSPASLVTPKARSPLTAAATSTPASVSSVGDLRGLAASGLDSLKRRLEALHADNARDLEASHSRISKRIKMQTQSCVQMSEEADKEHKKMLDNYSQQADEMKASYKKLMTDVQSSSSRVCKVTLPEMQKSVARAIDGMRTRYNIPATTA